MSFSLIQPPWLQPGDLVGITATARAIQKDELSLFISYLESWGLKVMLSSNIGKVQDQFAGSDAERAAAFNELAQSKNVKAIFCARGGYGTARILDKIDAIALRKHPKWVVGFSDVTALHCFLWKELHLPSIHAVMPSVIRGEDPQLEVLSMNSLKKALFGDDLKYTLPEHPFNRGLSAQGALLGGNLSVWYSLRGTVYEPETDGCILAFEDLDEYLYHIDRMMLNLNLGGRLKNIKALLCGGMTEMNDNTIPFGWNAEEIIHKQMQQHMSLLRFNVPFGHLHPNLALRFGMMALIDGNQLLLPAQWR